MSFCVGLNPEAPGSVQTEVMDDAVLVSWSEPEGLSVYHPTSYIVLWGTRLVEDREVGEQRKISAEFGHHGNLSVPSVRQLGMLQHCLKWNVMSICRTC